MRAGLVILALFAGAALLSFGWTPWPTDAIDVAARLQPPSAAHWLGTDALGRDVLSLVMAGARISLAVAAGAVAAGASVGIAVGLFAAVRGGLADAALMRVSDVAFALPALLLAILLAAVIGPGATSAAAAIAIFNAPVFARVTRTLAQDVWHQDFVAAARVAGRTRAAIARVHVLPNIAGGLLVQGTVQLSLALIAEAALSAVGLGVQPPIPSWGRMLADAQTRVTEAPWLVLAPGVAITLAVLGFTLVGDALDRRAR